MDDSFLLSLHGPVAHLQLNRPERANALSPMFFAALRDALRGLGADGVVRALVISATGAQFSAGLAANGPAGAPAAPRATPPRSDRRDPNESAAREAVGAILHMLDEPAPAGQALRPSVLNCLNGLNVVADAPFPVICAVQGGCHGVAVALACAADIRLCSADASFTPHDDNEHGHITGPMVLQALARLLPQGVVRELAYAGGRLGAEQARQLGFVNMVLPDSARLLQHALMLASRISARAPLAVAAAMLAMRQADAPEGVVPASLVSNPKS